MWNILRKNINTYLFLGMELMIFWRSPEKTNLLFYVIMFISEAYHYTKIAVLCNSSWGLTLPPCRFVFFRHFLLLIFVMTPNSTSIYAQYVKRQKNYLMSIACDIKLQGALYWAFCAEANKRPWTSLNE